MDQSDTDTNGNRDTNTDEYETGDTKTEGASLSSRLALVGAIAVVGIAGSGVVVNVLDRIGPPGSGELMWIFGYGLTIFALWYLLLRPIDLRGA